MSRSDISTTPAPGTNADGAGRADPAEAAIWVIQSYRAGENTQLLGLAERLGRPFRTVSLGYRRGAGLLGLLRRATLAGLDAASRARIAGPWPELVISAGLRNEPVCAYIRRASGGRTRVVFLGRTWCRHDALDLLVTTPQYRIEPAPGVLVNLLTQHRVTPERLAEAARRHAGCFDGRPRPLIAVLLGGSSGPYVLGPASAGRLARELDALVRVTGGSLAVSSSSRTPEAFCRALFPALAPEAFVYRWRPDDPENPYYAMLARADLVVVTGDSVAMLSEAAATGKPVLIFDIPTGPGGDVSTAARFYRWMMRWLPRRLTRDVGLFHRQFVAAGYGRLLDGEARPADWREPGSRVLATTDQTVARVLGLLDPGAARPRQGS
jgi:mitochondrial fission protein ELM1